VQRVGRDSAALHAAGKLLGEQHVAQLRDGVLAQPGDAAGGLAQRAEVNALGLVVVVTGDGDHAGRGGGFEAAEQRDGEREVPEVVDPEGQLEAVPGQAALPGNPGVVDEHVQRLAQGAELLRAPPHRREVGQVERQERDLVVPGLRPDAGRGCLALGARPAGQVDAAAPGGELVRGGAADPRVAARHKERPPRQITHSSSS
jgi:hypothetical protein